MLRCRPSSTESSSCIHLWPFLKTSDLFDQSYSFIRRVMPSANLETLVTLLGKEKPTCTCAGSPPEGGLVERLRWTTLWLSSALTLSMWRILSAYAFSSSFLARSASRSWRLASSTAAFSAWTFALSASFSARASNRAASSLAFSSRHSSLTQCFATRITKSSSHFLTVSLLRSSSFAAFSLCLACSFCWRSRSFASRAACFSRSFSRSRASLASCAAAFARSLASSS